MEDPKSSVKIAYKNDIEYTQKNALLMSALGSMLQLRYTETLREQEGGVYSPSAWGSLFKEPRSIGYVSVSFDCNPDLADKLVKIVHAEMEAMKKGNIDVEDLEKTKTNMLKDRADSKNFNAYEMTAMKNLILEGYNMNAPENFEAIVKSMTKKDIQNIAKQLLKNYKSYEIVFRPAK